MIKYILVFLIFYSQGVLAFDYFNYSQPRYDLRKYSRSSLADDGLLNSKDKGLVVTSNLLHKLGNIYFTLKFCNISQQGIVFGDSYFKLKTMLGSSPGSFSLNGRTLKTKYISGHGPRDEVVRIPKPKQKYVTKKNKHKHVIEEIKIALLEDKISKYYIRKVGDVYLKKGTCRGKNFNITKPFGLYNVSGFYQAYFETNSLIKIVDSHGLIIDHQVFVTFQSELTSLVVK